MAGWSIKTPPIIGPGLTRKLKSLLSSLRDDIRGSNIISINVRSVVGTEKPAAFIKPTPNGTNIDLIVGGGSQGKCPLQLYNASVTTGASITPRLGVIFSSVNGAIPPQFVLDDKGNYIWEFVIGGYTEVYAHIVINSSGVVTSANLEYSALMPDNTATGFYFLIGIADVITDSSGNITVVAGNARYGPLGVTVCRDWFTYPAAYGVSVSAVACQQIISVGPGGGGSGS